MTEQERIELLDKAKSFFRDTIVKGHIDGGLKRASSLSGYNVNPFLYKYLADFLRGNDDPRSIAEALMLPRILGSSITTSFGMHIQAMINLLFEGFGSAIQGIDIEFIDATDGEKKYCQVKSGPNTINHDDIKTIFDHFAYIRNKARLDGLKIGLNDLTVGVIYGEYEQLSTHYKDIEKQHPVHIGKDFWHRLTGKEDFYYDIIEAFGEVANEVDASEKLEIAVVQLTQELTELLKE